MHNDKVILITGTSSGFGHLLVAPLAAKGHRVYATMRGVGGKNAGAAAALQQLAAAGLPVRVLEMDVTDPGQVQRAVGSILAEAGRIDVAINNAGFMPIGATEAFTAEQFRQLLETNVLGVFHVNQAVLPDMRRRGSGLLVHLSSIAGRLVIPAAGIYNASKFAVEALAESLRYELAPFGVDSIIIEPGPFATNLATSSPSPANAAVAAEYGLLTRLRQQMASGAEQGPGLPDTDPMHVVDAIVTLISMPAGKRPLRTELPPAPPLVHINQETARAQRAFMAARGFGALLSIQAAQAAAAGGAP